MQMNIVSFCNRKEVVHLKDELERGLRNRQIEDFGDIFNLEKYLFNLEEYCISHSDSVKTN